MGTDTETTAASGAAPWLARPEWASPQLVARQTGKTVGLWLAALVWCGFCVPANLALLPELAAGNYAVLVILLFDLVGLGLLAAAVRQTLARRRYGDTVLQMEPYPGCIGGEVGGYFDVRLPYAAERVFEVDLACIRTWVSGSGKQRSTRQEAHWQEQRRLHGEPSLEGHTRVWFAFAPPAGLPASEAPSNDYTHWTLGARCAVPGVDYAQSWELPVFALTVAPVPAATATGAAARRMRVALAEEAAAVEAATGFTQTAGGAAMDYPAGRQWPAALALVLLFGGGFGGGGVAMHLLAGDVIARWIMAPLLLLIGLAGLLGGLWQLGNRLRVEGDLGGVRIRRWLFGVPVASHDIPHADIAGIGFCHGSTLTAGGRVTQYYDLVLRQADGRLRQIGRGLRGSAEARQAVAAFALYVRLPELGEIPRLAGLPWQRPPPR